MVPISLSYTTLTPRNPYLGLDPQTSPPPVPMETPVLANATDLGGLLSASWVEVPFAELELLGVIGEGAFGKVHKARWRGKVVAVKALSTDGNGGAMRCVFERTPRTVSGRVERSS
jgi:hypothetical protein